MMPSVLARAAAACAVRRATVAAAAPPLRAFALRGVALRSFAATSSSSSSSEASVNNQSKAGGEAGASNGGKDNDAAGAGAAAAVEQQLAALKAEADELKKQLQYAFADRENIRRILMRDVKDAKEFGMREFAKDLLDVSDNFERALAAAKADAARLPEVKALYDGVAMTEQQLHKVFERYGIKRTAPLGEKFNPQTHAALMELHSDEHADGHVAVVIKSGFLIKDRVLRPAEVGVVKKAPKSD